MNNIPKEVRRDIQVMTIKDTSKNPRFLGVPSQEQVNESASLEGLFGGRPIERVVEEDTNQLRERGTNWEEGISVLKRLAISLRYIEDHGELDQLPGFPDLEFKFTGAPFQFSELIDIGIEQGDGTYKDLIAGDASEARISWLKNGEVKSTVVNPQTLFLAEAYHVLEKGNRYELSGDDLADIIAKFDEESFSITRGWMDDQKEVKGAIVGHKEKILYGNGNEATLTVLRHGGLWLIANSEQRGFFRLTIKANQDKEFGGIKIESSILGGKPWEKNIIDIDFTDGSVETVNAYANLDTVDINPDRAAESFDEQIKIGKKLLERALRQKGELVKGMEAKIYETVFDTPQKIEKVFDHQGAFR